jgi:alanyl-tRNA synthetase
MEIWNNVFMQFDRQPDGTLVPLPKPAVDTGMGLERISTVMQGTRSNYDTDLFQGIIRHIEKLAGKRYRDNDRDDVSMRVIADHSRAVTFLICDGVLPSNEGRGYVLRRIMRRAARHAKMLGASEPLLYRTVDAVNAMMGEQYPELLAQESYIKKVIRAEEERFAETLDRGLAILNDEVARLRAQGEAVLPGEAVFRLYDTFGFPVDLTADIVQAEGFGIDEDGFALCMERQRLMGREHWKGSGEERLGDVFKKLHNSGITSTFVGYSQQTAYAPIIAIIRDGEVVEQAVEGDDVDIITAVTPFYGESGGQCGDSGIISTGAAHLEVTSTLRPFTDLTVHRGRIIKGVLKTGDAADLRLATAVRAATARNHTATHLLQSALRQVLGDHVKQAGSQVAPDRLRFDFTHFSPLTRDETKRIEALVNAAIIANTPVSAREMAVTEAMESGATALFGEKYGDTVRVVSVGEVSSELCGGTHVSASGDIGLFKIVSEGGIAAGVRRIEAVTGEGALGLVQDLQDQAEHIAALIKAEGGDLVERINRLLNRQKELQREVETLQGRLASSASADLVAGAREVSGVRVVAAQVTVADAKALREMADHLKDRLGSGIVVLGTTAEGKTSLLVAVTPDLTGRFRAGDIIKQLAPMVGGNGGGKPELAQAGGTLPDRLPAALEAVYSLIGG